MHEEQNESRKLTDAERGEKKQRKIMENTTVTGVHVAVYRVKDLSDPAVKFKVESNCNQLHMTGIVLLCKSLNVVVVEGGKYLNIYLVSLIEYRPIFEIMITYNIKQVRSNNVNSSV